MCKCTVADNVSPLSISKNMQTTNIKSVYVDLPSKKKNAYNYLEIPQLPSCVGGCSSWTGPRSAQPLPQLILGPLSDSTCLVKCLRGFERVAVTALNEKVELGSAQPLPWFYPGPMGDPKCSTRELLLGARAGQVTRTKCTKLFATPHHLDS